MDSLNVNRFCSLSVSDTEQDSFDPFYCSQGVCRSDSSSSNNFLVTGSHRSSLELQWEKQFENFIHQSRQRTIHVTATNQSTTNPDDNKRSELTRVKNTETYSSRMCRSHSESSSLNQLLDSRSHIATSTSGVRSFKKNSIARDLSGTRAQSASHDALHLVANASHRAAAILRQFSQCWS